MGKIFQMATKTIIDSLQRPLLDLRISVTDRCNFRCSYCMPKSIFNQKYPYLPKSDIITYEEILRVVKLLIPFGLRKVRITGGEPFIRHDLTKFLKELVLLPNIKVSITTNGSLLEKHLDFLRQIGINQITISLDSITNQNFKKIINAKFSIDEVLAAIDQSVKLGFTIKINMVVIKDINHQEILPMVEYFRSRYPNKVILRFIEFMDVGNYIGWQMDKVISAKEIFSIIHNRFPLKTVVRDNYGEVATRYQFEDGIGEVGIISSVTKPFCRDCTRMRLTANGKLFTCLFASSGYDLKTLLRDGSDRQLINTITDIWHKRDDRYSELRATNINSQNQKVEMSFIGG